MNKDLTVALYQSINTSDGEREISNWHASSLAKCPRALYFERKQVPILKANEPGGGKKLRWRAGHAIEATIRPELESLFPNLVSNVRFTNEELDLTGEFDDYDPDSRQLISVKSVHDFAFIERNGTYGLKEETGTAVSKRTGKEIKAYDLKKTPYLHHEWQEHAYVLLLRDEDTEVVQADRGAEDVQIMEKAVEQITYIYITLGGLIACYTTPVSDSILKRVSDKVKYLNECWKASKVPMCLCQEGQEMFKVQDQYCGYRSGAGCCSESLLNNLKEKANV